MHFLQFVVNWAQGQIYIYFKVKFALEQAMKAQKGKRGIAVLLL